MQDAARAQSRGRMLVSAEHERSLSRSPFSPTKLMAPPPPGRNSGDFSKYRSRNGLSRASSVSSATTSRDIDTMYSASSVNSPASTCYNSEASDWTPGLNFDSWRIQRQSRHHYRQLSTGSSNWGWSYESDNEQKRRDYEQYHHVSPIAESGKSSRDTSPSRFSSNDTEVLEDARSPNAQWDISSAVSEDVSPEDAESILLYTMQLVYGIELPEDALAQEQLKQATTSFIHQLSPYVWQSQGSTDGSWQGDGSAASSNTSPGSSGASSGRGKKHSRNGDDEAYSPDERGTGPLSAKRTKKSAKEDENLRLSCPYRKRNPFRFNVRDHHPCAMTYFPKFAELRQHIVKQHKRDDPSAFVCDRCTRNFHSRKELRDHQRLPKEQMCDITDHDAESGIDASTATKLLSRKRAGGSSPELQWREVWNILFPDDGDDMVQPHAFIPVVEHFELASDFLGSLNTLKDNLRDNVTDAAALETVSNKLHLSFIEALDRCTLAAQTMRYINRSNKKTEFLKQQEKRDNASPSTMSNPPDLTASLASLPLTDTMLAGTEQTGRFSLVDGYLAWDGDDVQQTKKSANGDISAMLPPDGTTAGQPAGDMPMIAPDSDEMFNFWATNQ